MEHPVIALNADAVIFDTKESVVLFVAVKLINPLAPEAGMPVAGLSFVQEIVPGIGVFTVMAPVAPGQ